MDMAEHTISHGLIGAALGGNTSLDTSQVYHGYVPDKH